MHAVQFGPVPARPGGGFLEDAAVVGVVKSLGLHSIALLVILRDRCSRAKKEIVDAVSSGRKISAQIVHLFEIRPATVLAQARVGA
jgi:hypothetical protein